jgi:hypothetical protein
MIGKFLGLFHTLGRNPAVRTPPHRPRPLQVEALEERAIPATVTVSGQANIYGAGLTAPPAPGGGGGGVLPTLVSLASLGNPRQLDFPSVSGTVSGWAAAGGYNGPDGGPFWGGFTNVPAWGGISGIRDNHATMFLVGVFLGPNGQPASAPPTPDVTGANDVLAPLPPPLGQQFFIGDGFTSSRALQTFAVPAGATRLFLGFAEKWGFGSPHTLPGFYGDNGGSLRVTVDAALSFELQNLAPPAATRGERVAEWIHSKQATINSVAQLYHVDAVAIAGAIAWEALENALPSSWRGAGPGKIHVSDSVLDTVFPLNQFVRGSGVARQAEDLYAADPNPARRLTQLTVAQRQQLLSTNPDAAIKYIGAIMGAYAAEADTVVGYNLHNGKDHVEILATLYNGAQVDGQAPNADLLNFTAKLRNKHGAPMSYVGNPMGTWVHANLAYLASALHP